MYKKHDIEKMKELRRQGISQAAIARITGASKQIVSYHLKHIDPVDGDLGACIYCKSAKKVKLHYRKGYEGDIVYVGCSKCHARGPSSLDVFEAIDRWNAVNKLK